MPATRQTLIETFVTATLLSRYSGLFPYSYHIASNAFTLSWPLLLFALLQALIYFYVNVSLMLADWRNYAQPVASSSSLAVVGNLLLRMLGLMATTVSLLPALLGSRRLVKDINRLLRLVDDFVALSFNTQRLNRQIRLLSLASNVALFVWVSLNCWHAVHFYKLLTGRTASLAYYMVVALSDYYRMLFIFFMRLQLVALYCMSQQLNEFMQELVNLEHECYERQRSRAIAWAVS